MQKMEQGHKPMFKKSNGYLQMKNVYQRLAINNRQTMLITASENKIFIHSFFEINGKFKLVYKLTQHENTVSCLNLMNNDSFVSASHDCTIKIWTLNSQNQWNVEQTLTGHTKSVRRMTINKSDDLIVTGSDDMTIKFWKKKIYWQLQQDIQCRSNSILALCLNEDGQKLIVMELQDQILIYEFQNQKEWVILQEIHAQLGSQITFLSNNQFVYIPLNKNTIEIYQSDNKLFKKQNDLQIPKKENCIIGFPLQFSKQKQILLARQCYKVLILQLNPQGYLELIQEIHFESQSVYGTLSKNGDFMIIWEPHSALVQIWKSRSKLK